MEYWPGSWFGELALFMPVTVDSTLRATNFIEVLEVSRLEMTSAVGEFPEMLRMYNRMKALVKSGNGALLDDLLTCAGGESEEVQWKGSRNAYSVSDISRKTW